MSILRKIKDQECLKELDALLSELVASHYAEMLIGSGEKDKIIELRQRMNRLYLDILSPCDECEHKACPWRNDSTEECIYYREQSN